jgi:tetratricopeptide (TPR) repeat protein
MQLKSIIQGKLDFGSESSYEKALKMFLARIENYYKIDILIKDEELFDVEQKSIVIKRLIAQGPEKLWNNTVDLLEYLSQFAISGHVGAWLVHEGKILKYATIEPEGDKAVVQNFLKGKKLSYLEGKEKEALDSLTKVITKYDNHALAYERRGYVNFVLKNFSDALYDFNKCLKIDASIPMAYYWRAKVHLIKKDLNAALVDLDMTTKKAIALQPIYWKARLLKADCYIKLKDFEKAVFELKLFTNRKFETDNPNYAHRQNALYQYAEVLMNLKQYDMALAAVEKAITLEHSDPGTPLEKLLTLRGMAKHQSGASGKADWKQAADLGSEEAQKLLTEFG